MHKVRLGVITLGCDKNRVDSEKLLGEIIDFAEIVTVDEAEYVFINTCSFIKPAREELMNILDGLREKKLILAGCFYLFLDDVFRKKYPNIVRFVRPDEYGRFREIFSGIVGVPLSDCQNPEAHIRLTPPSYSYIKIADGCDNFCSFCLIPKIKGRYKSRPKNEVLKEIREKVSKGVKEIILIAQNTGNYGNDLKNESLVSLLKDIEKSTNVRFVRLLYLYPECVTDELLNFMQQSRRTLPYFDIPLQHIDDALLKNMNRKYSEAEAKKLIETIRAKLPHAVIRTSLIVGFPGETEREFKKLCSFLKKYKLQHVGVFPYSDEPLAASYKLPDKISEDEKKKRYEKVLKLQKKISTKYLRSFVGTAQEVLVDKAQEPGVYVGRSYHFTPDVDGVVIFSSEKKYTSSDVVKVSITDASEYDLFGEC